MGSVDNGVLYCHSCTLKTMSSRLENLLISRIPNYSSVTDLLQALVNIASSRRTIAWLDNCKGGELEGSGGAKLHLKRVETESTFLHKDLELCSLKN